MKKVFITGGAGYVGAVLTPYLISKGYFVTIFDLMIYGEKPIKENKNLKIIRGDIRNTELLQKCIFGQDVVIHLACISNDPSFELNPKLGKSINLDAFEPLVQISKKNNVSRFIYASSSSVYGLKEDKNIDEKTILSPLTDYSKFKAECENILTKYHSNVFNTIIARPATVCGYSPRQRLDLVVNILTNLAYHKREISVFGGNQLRPNIHIFDMARAYEMLISAPIEKVSGEVFNIGFENHKVIDLAETVKKIIGQDVKIKKTKSDDHRSYHISSKKIKRILGFNPKKTIEDAIIELKNVFDKKILKDTLNNEFYFNIKRMSNINLQ